MTSADFPPGELIENTTTVSLEQLSSQPVSRVIVRAPGMALADFEVAVRSAGLHAVEYAIGWTAWLDGQRRRGCLRLVRWMLWFLAWGLSTRWLWATAPMT